MTDTTPANTTEAPAVAGRLDQPVGRLPPVARKTMHTAPMADSQGEFAEFKTQPEVPCRECGVHAVSMREWESSCGGWEDYQYKCHHCGYAWWEEGIDA